MLDVISIDRDDYIETYNGDVRYNCPFCLKTKGSPDTDHKLYVIHGEKKKGDKVIKDVYNCFRCGATGKASKLFKSNLYDSVSKYIRPKAKVKARQLSTRKEIEAFFKDNTKELSESAVAYLKGRRLTESNIVSYGLKEGTGVLKDRVVLPCIMYGRIVYFMARKFKGVGVDYRCKWCVGRGLKGCRVCRRYENPPNSSRSKVLFNYDNAKKYRSVIICEGGFSAISAGLNAVATLGTSVTPEQLKLLSDEDWQEYNISFDFNTTKQTNKVASYLLNKGKYVTITDLPSDPNDVDDFMSYYNKRIPYTENFLLKKWSKNI